MKRIEPVFTSEITKKNGRSKIIVNSSGRGADVTQSTIVTVVTAAASVPSSSTSTKLVYCTWLMDNGSLAMPEKLARDPNALVIPRASKGRLSKI